jgi:8-oxo-dGTP pyrophosphatase MutT (NUDIX family)
VTAPFDPILRLPRALHPLAAPPAGPGWNRAELHDLLPADAPLRPAAVLVALVERPGGPRVLLTRRTDALRHHAGQVSFPGGRIEAGDADPVAAALREAHEEVGLAASQSTPRGYLDPFVTITGFHVFPVVATVAADYVARIDPSEVAEAFEVPLPFVLDPRNVQEHDVDWQGRRRRLLEFRWEGHRIWGATAAMLVNFRRRLEAAG